MLLANENVLSAILCVFACVSSTEAYFQKLGRWKPSLQGKNRLLVLVFIVVNRLLDGSGSNKECPGCLLSLLMIPSALFVILVA